MLLSLSIRNFKQHRELEVDFASGMTLITGENYTGKSNLTKAILFALGGSMMLPGNAASIPTRGEKKGSVKVVLRLNVNDSIYTITRTMSSAKLERDGEKVATGNKAVNQEVEDLLGVDRNTFNLLKYVKQGNTQTLLTLGSTKLHTLLESLSGVGVINDTVGKLGGYLSRLRGMLDGIGPAAENLDQIRGWKERYDVDLPNWYEQLQTLHGTLQSAQSDWSAVDQQLQEVRRQNAASRAMGTEWERYQLEVTRLAQQRQELEAAESKAKARADQAAALRADLEAVRIKVAHIDRLRSELNAAYEEISRYRTRYEDLEADLGFRQTQFDSNPFSEEGYMLLSEDYHGYHAKLEVAEERVKSLTQACTDAVCPTCDRPFEDHDPEALNAERETAEREYEDLYDKAIQTQDAYEEAGRQKRKWDDMRRALDRVKTSKQQYLEVIVEKEQAATTKKAELDSAMSLLQGNENAEYDRLNAEYEAVRHAPGQHQQLVQQLSAVVLRQDNLVVPPRPEPVDQELEDTLVGRLTQLAEQARNLQQHHTEYSAFYTAERAKWESWSATLDAEESRQAREREVNDQIEVATRLRKFLTSNRDRFMGDLWEQIMSMTSQFAATCTNGVIEAVTRDDKGHFKFVEAGMEDSVEEASGAQRSIMSIGLLVALNTLIPGSFGALILDEPGADMDDAHSVVVNRMLSEAGTQLVVISHRSLDASMEGAHIHLERGDG